MFEMHNICIYIYMYAYIYIYLKLRTFTLGHIIGLHTSGGLVSVAAPMKLAPCCVYVAAIDQDAGMMACWDDLDVNCYNLFILGF